MRKQLIVALCLLSAGGILLVLATFYFVSSYLLIHQTSGYICDSCLMGAENDQRNSLTFAVFGLILALPGGYFFYSGRKAKTQIAS